jgi:hypothetical protein
LLSLLVQPLEKLQLSSGLVEKSRVVGEVGLVSIADELLVFVFLDGLLEKSPLFRLGEGREYGWMVRRTGTEGGREAHKHWLTSFEADSRASSGGGAPTAVESATAAAAVATVRESW